MVKLKSNLIIQNNSNKKNINWKQSKEWRRNMSN